MARSEIEKILDRDSLQKALEALVEVNPEHVVMAYQAAGGKKFFVYWYGEWTTCIGLSEVLRNEVMGDGPDEGGEDA